MAGDQSCLGANSWNECGAGAVAYGLLRTDACLATPVIYCVVRFLAEASAVFESPD